MLYLTSKTLINCKLRLKSRAALVVPKIVVALPLLLLRFLLLTLLLEIFGFDHKGLGNVVGLVAQLVHSIEEVV